MKPNIFAALLITLMLTGCNENADQNSKPEYQANWESLRKHTAAPQWFRDAKFGVYFHWGVYSVPAFGSEWYPRNMHIKDSREYKHHVEKYGDPAEFGYHDFVPEFGAEEFDADEWAELFARAGAQFAGPVAEHHDGFAMWDSEVTPWNVKDRGPKRDITGELEKAIRKRGMKFITTFHHARNNLWKKEPGKWMGHYSGVKKDFPSLLEDEKNAILYGYMPRSEFIKFWKAKLMEVVDGYRPDIIWFDSWLDEIPEQDRYEFASYYFNKSNAWNKDVVIVRKQEDLPLDFSVLDHEKSRMSGASENVWMTDDTISTGSWCYTNDLKVKSVKKVVHALIDTVSKNGIVLLNISPKANGTIPADQQQVLLELGDWMRVNGEGIYATRPWKTYGQGPTKEPEGGFGEADKFLQLQYSANDIRFTQSKDGKDLYAIVLGWPGKEELVLDSVLVKGSSKKSNVTLLGYNEKIKFKVDGNGRLVITLPKLSENQRPCKFAYAFKISDFELGVGPFASGRKADTQYEPFNYVLGTQTFGIQYQFTEKSSLVETAEVIQQLGSNILKCYLGRGVFTKKHYTLPKNDEIKSLKDLVEKEPSFAKVLDMDFDFYQFWIFPFGPDKDYPEEIWHGGVTKQERGVDYKEVYDLASYLLKKYSGTGKKFYFGNWEGDWAMMGWPYSDDRTPAKDSVQGMIDTYRTRRRAIDDAKAATAHHNVDILLYIEVNRVQKAIKGGVTVTNNVLPFIDVDYVSYSTYDSIAPIKAAAETGKHENATDRLIKALDYIESKLPEKKGIEGKRVFIGEYGFARKHVSSPEVQDTASRIVAKAAIEWGCPFVLYWEIYCNENLNGFWMIDEKNQKQPIYYTHKRFLEKAKKYVEDFRTKHKRNPTNEEYSKVAANWL